MKGTLLFYFFCLGVSLYAQTNASAPEALPWNNFAGTIELNGNAGSLLSLEIPEAVYLGIERPDMGDVRIYDSQGNPASFVIRNLPGTIAVPSEQDVPILAWNEKAGRFTASIPGIEINTSGIAVTINPGSGRENRLYLADLSGLDNESEPSKLVLDFEEGAFFNAGVSIQKSDDLAQWERFDRTQTAAFNNNPGTDRNVFDIPRARYILLEFDGEVPPVNSALVRFDPIESPAALRETSFTGTQSEDRKNVVYRTGRFPVQKVNFVISRPDSIRVIFRERTSEAVSWHYLGESSIYRIEAPNADPLVNGPIESMGSGPYWQIDAQGEQVFTEVPSLVLLWEAQEIVFLARGQGPWTLAYGNVEYGPLVPLDIQSGAEILPALSGAAFYTGREEPKADHTARWRQIILWSVLILAAAVLSVLALWVIKSMKSVNGG
jgi:hypothetical protein